MRRKLRSTFFRSELYRLFHRALAAKSLNTTLCGDVTKQLLLALASGLTVFHLRFWIVRICCRNPDTLLGHFVWARLVHCLNTTRSLNARIESRDDREAMNSLRESASSKLSHFGLYHAIVQDVFFGKL